MLGKELGYEVSRKLIKKITVSYTFEGTVLDKVEKIKYPGITITNNLKCNTGQQYRHKGQ